MILITYLPLFVTLLFRGMPGIWQGRHRHLLCWLVCMQASSRDRKPWKNLRVGPSLDHRVAIPPPVEGELLEYPSAGDMVAEEALHTLPRPRMDAPSCG